MRETNDFGGRPGRVPAPRWKPPAALDKPPLCSMLGAMDRWLRCLCACFVMLAPATPAAASQQVVTRVWQSQDGLPGNVVRSLVQSSDGYLWVATAEGIARFDGFDFHLVTPAGDLRRFRLSFFRLFATSNGDVWAATYQGGLFRVKIDGLERILPNIRRPQPPLVTQMIDGGTHSVVFRRGDEYGRVSPGGEVTLIEPDELLRGRFAEDLERQLQGGRAVADGAHPVLTDRRGRTWIADASGGLHVTGLDGEPVRVDFGGRLFAFGINELHEDREGNIWVASPVNGLARLRPARVETVDVSAGSGDRTFLSVMQDESGSWWFAARRGGLVQWTPEETRTAEFSATRFHRSIAAVYQDRERRIWAASRDGSVFLRTGGRFEPQFTRTQVPSKVRCIVQSLDGTVWFGGTQGLSTLSGETVRRFGPQEGIGKEVDLTVLKEFPDGRLICGSTSGRILLGNSAGFVTIASPEVTGHQWISGILPLATGETWVTTLGSGLFLWNGRKWHAFGANEGLPDLRLTSIVRDGKGNLWIGSLGGIVRVDRSELLRHLNDSSSPIHWLVLDHSDGLPSRECIGGYQPGAWIGDDGRVWFPTGAGVVRVNPDEVRMSRKAPPIYLQSARVNGVPHLGENGPIVSKPGRARLEFRFVGLNLKAPEKTTYRARLAGLDNEWRELGNQRVAAFEAVPPGRYTFEVMAVNGDGIRSSVPARVPVVIRPHFWETPWFSSLAVLSVVAVAAGTGAFISRRRLKARIQALKIRSARESERSRIARDLHDELGASLTEISILAALASEDASETPLEPSLDQLSTKAKHVVSSLDEIVWAVNPREDTLRSLVDYITAFAREFLDTAKIQLRVSLPTGIPEMRLVASQRHSVFLAAREALNNIVKHAQATEVNLDITCTDGEMTIRIQDDGVGFEPDYAAGGNGLGNLGSRMRDAGGDCDIQTRRRQGTTVVLTLPLHPVRKPVSS